MNDLEMDYYSWILRNVFNEHKNKNYQKLLNKLFATAFRYSIPMDKNRESDGINLRYEYCQETGKDYRLVSSLIDYRQCSILEMMIALARRGYRYFMPDFKNYVNIWFWDMINNLGLRNFTDDNYNDYAVSIIIENFLNRNYASDGYGGLFKINGFSKDLSKMEIWAQMTNYISIYYNK